MDLVSDEIRKIANEIQAERDASKLIALVKELNRLLDEHQASNRRTAHLGSAGIVDTCQNPVLTKDTKDIA